MPRFDIPSVVISSGTSAVPYSPYTRLDLALGWLAGTEAMDPLPAPQPGEGVRDVLQRVLREHMQRGAVAVSLSGERDSTAILANAVQVARTHGLADPIAISLRFNDARTRSDEVTQQKIVSALGLEDTWQRVVPEDGLEILGPDAVSALSQHGLQFPANVAWVKPVLRRLSTLAPSAPTTLFVAHGGGELYGFWPYARLQAIFHGQLFPVRSDLRLLGYAMLPRAVRAARERRLTPIANVPWLRPGVAEQLERQREPPAPLRWDRALGYFVTRRCARATQESHAALGRDVGVNVAFPMLDPRCQGASFHLGGAAGFGNRDQYLELLAGDLLPSDIASGRDRVGYGRLYFGAACRAFAERWSGRGLPEEIVDPDVLRDLWRSERYDWRTAPLLQAAWLHDHLA